MDDRIREILKELGEAINDSISSSEDVNHHIQRIRDEGYNLYVVLDATIGLGKEEDQAAEQETGLVPQLPAAPQEGAQFRINVNDLALLRGLGIDPTRKVKVQKRLEARISDVEERG
ncbi:MAG: hypothetical protein ABI718_06455 [Acidobacteriota bacterium]